MASQLQIKRTKLELSSIRHGKAETEFRIEEFQENIERLRPTLAAQIAKEEELVLKIKELESEPKENN